MGNVEHAAEKKREQDDWESKVGQLTIIIILIFINYEMQKMPRGKTKMKKVEKKNFWLKMKIFLTI